MRSIFPSAAVTQTRYALLSSLRAQGFGIGSFETGQPLPGDLFMVCAGEAAPAPARTVILAEPTPGEGPSVVPGRDGAPHRVTFDANDAAVGSAIFRNSFSRWLARAAQSLIGGATTQQIFVPIQ